MNSTGELYGRLLKAASLDGEDAAIRVHASYEPVGGPGDRVSPPVYPDGPERSARYLIERRWDEDGEQVDVVLLDSRQSQANRCEEALQSEVDAGELALPHLSLRTETHGVPLRITSLEAPHRSRDAYFRDAEDEEGTPFDETEVGAALRAVRADDATSLMVHSPADLVYGVWDSHRDLRLATRFPRIYTSEITGWGVLPGVRAAGRADLVVSGADRASGGNQDWLPVEGESKGTKKLSELGHGSIPPGPQPGGVTVRRIARSGSIGFAGLARVSFGGIAEPAARAARAVLAALALLGDRAAFGRPGLFLRSGCELVLSEESLGWVSRGGKAEPLALDLGGARTLLAHAVAEAAAAGLRWQPLPLVLRPQPKLQELIDKAFFKSPLVAEAE